MNDRIHNVQRFDHHLRALNVQIQRVAQIKVRHIESYIHERLAQDAMCHYLALGFSRKETLAMVATDLGHGDGRGRYEYRTVICCQR